MSKTLKLLSVTMLAMLVSCGNKSTKSLAEQASAPTDYEQTDVNAIQQALPTLMVLPSDNLLENYNALSQAQVEGKNIVLRNYQDYLLNNNENLQIVTAIQDKFIKKDYPISDLEQTLKQLNTQEATDMADHLEKDSKTILLTTAMPDIILELDYQNKMNLASHDVKDRQLSFTLRALDAYTNKVVATINENDIKGDNAVQSITSVVDKQMDGFSGDIVKYFSDILYRGREVTLRIAVEQGSNVHLTDTNVEGDTYADWVIDYLKTHTVKGAYKLQRNTDNELYFVNVRIPLLANDGTQYGVYDWTRDFCMSLRKDLGVKATNKAQGLGEIMITISGL